MICDLCTRWYRSCEDRVTKVADRRSLDAQMEELTAWLAALKQGVHERDVLVQDTNTTMQRKTATQAQSRGMPIPQQQLHREMLTEYQHEGAQGLCTIAATDITTNAAPRSAAKPYSSSRCLRESLRVWIRVCPHAERDCCVLRDQDQSRNPELLACRQRRVRETGDRPHQCCCERSEWLNTVNTWRFAK